MVITAAAAQVIREWLRASSNLSRPAIYLGQVSDVPAEVAEAQRRGVDRRELAEITTRALKSQPKRLCPLVYPSSHFNLAYDHDRRLQIRIFPLLFVGCPARDEKWCS